MTNHQQYPSSRRRTARSRSVLVIGATGTTGSRVARGLTDAGHRVLAASRSSAVRFDWQQPATWPAALRDADAVYITYSPDLALPGAADTVGRFANLAVASGVRRLVLLSGRGEAGAQLAENLVVGSGADATIVRCAFFNQNFDGPFLESVRQGTLALPAGDTVEPFLDADDIADVVVAALTDDRHIGERYELTGDRLLSMRDVAAELSTATGRPIEYHDSTVDQFADGLAAGGYPAADAAAIAALIAEVLDGRNAHLADGVGRALGRAPRPFAEYARATAATGVWDVEQPAEAVR